MRIRSHCTGHFPHVRFRDGQRYLYQPIAGKLLADRPEERVRLRSIDYLLQGDVWPAVHIATEKGSTTKGELAAGRFDLLLYNRELMPTVLIECKAPTIAITEQTSQQIARYNTEIMAPILCMTNGLIDHWFVHKGDGYEAHSGVPDLLRLKAPFMPDITYWRSTGFAGDETLSDRGLTDLLGVWFSGEAAENLINLNPGLSGTVAGMPHYYQVVQEKGMPVKLAFTVVSPDGVSTVLVVIRNVNGRNEAVLFLPLDAVYLGKETRYRLIRSSSDIERHLPEHMIDYLLEPDDAYSRLPVMLDDLFTL
jgi:hypothetical protein